MGDGEGWLEMVTAGPGEEEGLNVGDLKADVADLGGDVLGVQRRPRLL